ncbi:MAG: hypothetical protein ACOX1P_04010 [Thermoguttaceae bacterium]|jgi:hypothetical protein
MLTALLMASIVAGQVGENRLTPQDFQEYGELMVGRWIGDVTLVADLGFGKKGAKVVAHLTVRWIADRKGLEAEVFGGSGTGRSFIFLDPGSGTIKEYRVSSDGAANSLEIQKKDGTWVWHNTGHLDDGTPFEGNGETIVSASKDTMTQVGTGTIGGKSMLPLKDVYRKMSK